MDWQTAVIILGIIASFVGIAAGAVQVIDYAEKRRAKKRHSA